MKRLTVHLAEVKKVQIETDRYVYQHKGKIYKDSNEAPNEAEKIKEKKTILKNTITVRDLLTETDVNRALSKIKEKHTVAVYTGRPKANGRKSEWKPGEEMIHTAWQN